MASYRNHLYTPPTDAAEPFPAFPTSPGIGPSSPQPGRHGQPNTTRYTIENNNEAGLNSGHTSLPYAQHNTIPSIQENGLPINPNPYPRVTSQIRRRPIGITRLPSAGPTHLAPKEDLDAIGNRPRSTSALQGYHPGSDALSRENTRASPNLPTLEENTRLQQPQDPQTPGLEEEGQQSSTGRRRTLSNAARSVANRFSREGAEYRPPSQEYESNVVDFLDVVDPEVSTLTTLTNVQNSLFVPDLGRWLNRRPTYNLSLAPRITEQNEETPFATPRTTLEARPGQEQGHDEASLVQKPSVQRGWSYGRETTQLRRSHSISSAMTDSHYAVLPPGVTLDGWSEEDKAALDDHVRHMLHSKRSKFHQKMSAFKKYIRKPLGFFVTFYAISITLFGLAWVLFLIGWIYVGDRQQYIINVVDNVLVALFAVMGDGLAPFRIVDTYHMIYIAHYHHFTWDKRKRRGLPKLKNRNDLPTRREKEDLEAAKDTDNEYSILSEDQQRKLIHHQAKFARSHSFYKPHETSTHHAFPLRLLVAIVVLLDCHSLFQIALGTCTWAIDYRTRPAALTATILCCSITVNITAGILISIGDRRTRKKDVVTTLARQELTSQAMKKLQKDKMQKKQSLANAESDENIEIVRKEEQPSADSTARISFEPGTKRGKQA